MALKRNVADLAVSSAVETLPLCQGEVTVVLPLKKTCRMVRLELLLQKTWLAYNYAELECSHSQLFLEDAASFSMSEAQPCQQTGSFCIWPTPPSRFFPPIKVNKCSW